MCKLGGNTAGRHVFHTIQTHVCRKILRPKLAHKQTKGSMRLQTVLVHNYKRQNRREWQSLHSLNTKSKPDVWKIFISILSLRHKELYTVYCRGCTSNHYTSDSGVSQAQSGRSWRKHFLIISVHKVRVWCKIIKMYKKIIIM